MASTSCTAEFDFNMPLCMPRLDTRSLPPCDDETDEYEAVMTRFIGKYLHDGNIGKVKRVDLLEKKTPEGYKFYVAFVHFERWYDTVEARDLQLAIVDPARKAIFQYHPRWYWIVSKNTNAYTDEEHERAKLLKTTYAEIARLSAFANKLEQELRDRKKTPTDGPPPDLPPPVLPALSCSSPADSDLIARKRRKHEEEEDEDDDCSPPPVTKPKMVRQTNRSNMPDWPTVADLISLTQLNLASDAVDGGEGWEMPSEMPSELPVANLADDMAAE